MNYLIRALPQSQNYGYQYQSVVNADECWLEALSHIEAEANGD